jgi:DNA-binding MarR family transcriptional regulator
MTGNTDLFDLYASLRRTVSIEANSALKEIGLGTRQFIILWNLNRKKKMSVGELVEAAMTDAATVSRSLVQLIKNGYVEKVQCQNDGRVWYVKLSAKGADLAPQMEKVYRKLANRCFAVLNAQEREQFGQLLGKVVGSLESASESDRRVEASP